MDYTALKKRIADKCGTQKEFAKRMGLSERTVCLKLQSRIQWTKGEMEKAREVLGAEASELDELFYKVSEFPEVLSAEDQEFLRVTRQLGPGGIVKGAEVLGAINEGHRIVKVLEAYVEADPDVKLAVWQMLGIEDVVKLPGK